MTKPVGPDGQEIEPKAEYIPGIVAHLRPFEVDFKLRDPKYEQIIRSVEKDIPLDTRDAEILSKVEW